MDLLADLAIRMLPPGYLGEFVAPLVPLRGGARLIADWAGVAAWAVLLATACCSSGPRRPPATRCAPGGWSSGTARGRCRS